MNNDLINSNKMTLDSREVAEMLEKTHSYLLEMIQGRKGKLGIVPVLLNANLAVSDYFIESIYKDTSGKENKCYLCTKMGCEMLGNKLQGEKGILFSAKYVKRFNDMEKALKNKQDSYIIENPIERAKRWIEEQEERQQLEAQVQELTPFAELAKKRIDATGTVSITDMTKTYNLKRGQITVWAKNNGYIHKSQQEVNKSGELYFKVVSYNNEGFKSIGILEEGIKLIDANIEDIKNSPTRFKKSNK